MIGTDSGVTEIRSLAEQLREEKEALISSEARYRALTEAMPQIVWVLDAAVQLEYVNPRWSTRACHSQECACWDLPALPMPPAS
jgi:PAS domain-containing protein